MPLSRCGVVLVTNKSRCRVAGPSHVVLEFAVNRGTTVILSTFLLKKATSNSSNNPIRHVFVEH